MPKAEPVTVDYLRSAWKRLSYPQRYLVGKIMAYLHNGRLIDIRHDVKSNAIVFVLNTTFNPDCEWRKSSFGTLDADNRLIIAATMDAMVENRVYFDWTKGLMTVELVVGDVAVFRRRKTFTVVKGGAA